MPAKVEGTMTKLLQLRERISYSFEVVTPTATVLPSEQSAIITHVGVPPRDEMIFDDVLQILVGSRVFFEHPLKWLMDKYIIDLKPVADLYRQTGEQLSLIIEAILEKNTHLTRDPEYMSYPIAQLHKMHEVLGKNIKDLVTGSMCGIQLQRAIVVAPRQQISIECKLGSRVTVYLGGLLSREVS